MRTTFPVVSIFIFFLVALTTPVVCWAQETDFIGWTSIGIDKKINKKISLEGTVQQRRNNNLSQVSAWLYSLDFRYKINKKWRVLLQSRYRTSDQADALRLGAGFIFDLDLWKLKIDLRQVYQADLPMYQFSLQEGRIRHQLRTRLRAGYDIHKKITASLGAEPYFRFNEGKLFLARIRSSVALQFELAKSIRLETQYLFQPNYHPTGYLNNTDHIVSLGFNLKL